VLRDLEQALFRLPDSAGPLEARPRPADPHKAVPTVQGEAGWAGRSPAFVLIHSPLLGPTSWSLVAQELRRRGHEAIVPSLLGIAQAPRPQWRYALSAVRAMTIGLTSQVMLVGHAAAGPLLPAIADAVVAEVTGLIFVDSAVPPADGSASLASARFTDKLRALADDSLLPHASCFRQQVTGGLIPPESPAAELVEEAPALPLSYFTDRVPMPHAWTRRPCAYLLLNPIAHTESAIQAQARGWPVGAVRRAHHLSILTDARAVTDTLLHLTHSLHPQTHPGAP
jgi:hypothetical protein